MSVDVSGENPPPAQNGGAVEVHVNGMSNGHSSSSSKHKSSSKDKHRDKDRDKDRHKSSSSSSHKSSSRDKEKHSSSSSSSGKDKHRDKDRDEKHSSSSSSKSSHRDKDRDKDKERSSSDKEKHKSSSSSSSGHKSSSKDKEKRDKDRKESGSSSSSSSKDKDRHKSSSSSSSSRDKDKDKDRHHKSSSSSSSSKNKHSSSSSSKPSKQDVDGFIKPEPLSQPQENGFNNVLVDIKTENFKEEDLKAAYESSIKRENIKNEVKQEMFTQDPLDSSCNNGMNKEHYEMNAPFDVSQASSCDYSMSQFKEDEPAFVAKEEASYNEEDEDSQEMDQNGSQQYMQQEQADEEDDDDEDMPLAARKSKQQKPVVVEEEDDDEEDVPLAKRKLNIVVDEDDDEDVPLIARKKSKKETKQKTKEKTKEKKKKRVKEEEGDYTEVKPKKAKKSKTAAPAVKTEVASPTKRVKKEKKDEEEEEVWRWWEEEKREDGVKWNTLEHKGPVFAPPYERLPRNVRFFYDGKHLELTEETEEAATFYAKMLGHDYCTRQVFNDNFFKDFRKTMTKEEKDIIKDFSKCDFKEMNLFFTAESEKRKNASKEEKLKKKEENEALVKEYGVCIIDGHKEKIGNFRLEPPGLFRGRGEHPKMGMIKRRIQAEDVSINCGKDSKIPQPPPGHRWKEVLHNNTVTWLASWTENVQGQMKYIMLNPSSKLKGEKDHVKYETARRLAKSIDTIRNTYRNEWKSKEMRVRQRAVALYFIDKLALRAGNEKDEDQADTVGCCSLRVEHVSLHKELNGKENVVVFDFLGKDSIRYYNEVEVEKRVFKNLELFMENKKTGDDLFDRLNTQVLNEHLKELMEGLTAKVFRTYNASVTLQNQLDLLTQDDMTVPEKLLAYNRANRAVAILCNHQRSVPKSHEKSMENLKEKIRQKREQLDDAENEYEDLRRAAKRGSVREKVVADKKHKQIERLKEQLQKLELQETDRDENKTIALGTSKLNYLDPRISVAWCKKHKVPIEKIFNKTQRTKFLWAIHMADENYRF
ncbi:DNA topoisomerase 1 [Stomoxys calcitrans]|uniref:DNA topoisomerase I n=1 Tax=Stomoxys calcitrans TaxID=35570 RepID=A0A1I8PJU8_STOCA|nr:DNA topoisomerase 1 [Stomoxys calcitrans]XP_013107858.1 DNA topoisomerase 1 [Stomoxys calcitrans]